LAAGFASSSNRQIIDLALRQGALTECFRVTVSSKELDHGKLALTSAWMRRLGCCWSLTTSSSEATSMSDATSVDPTAVLFGLEEEFGVLEVQRIDPISVRMIIEQTARAGPCPACGMLTSVVKERPLRRLKNLPACGQTVELWWRKRRLMCREAQCRRQSFTQVSDVAREYQVSWPTAHKPW
jgi:hypothetical protein